MAKEINDSIFDDYLTNDVYNDEYDDSSDSTSNDEITDEDELDDEFIDDNSTDDEIIDDPLKIYLKDIDKYPILSNEDVIKYYVLMKNGDVKAKQMLINSNLRLVLSVAKRYLPMLTSMTFLDVIQEGNIGLVNGIEKFDPEKGALSTILIYWIRQSITRALADKNNSIRTPVHLYEKVGKYKKMIAQAKLNGRNIDEYELCNELELTLEDLEKIHIVISQDVVSMDKPVGDEDDSAVLGDFVADNKSLGDPAFEKHCTDDLLAVLRSVLTPVEYYILCERILFSNKKLEVIASQFFATRQWVNQTEIKVKEKVKPYLEKDSIIFIRKLDELRKGNAVVKNVKRRPTSPLDIVKYMYIKDRLTCIEKMLYWRLYFDEVSYSNTELANILQIRVSEIDLYRKSLLSKLKYIDDNMDDFKEFRKSIMEVYKSRIYKFIKENGSDITIKFEGFSYERFISLYSSFVDSLNCSDKDLIFRYFNDSRMTMSAKDKDKVYDIFDLILKTKNNGINMLLKLDKKD